MCRFCRETALLVTFDVTSLYTNIPLAEARIAAAQALRKSLIPGEMPTISSLLQLLDLVFTKNIFTFSTGKKLEYYLQTNGVSMGSRCAPSIACTFMAYFEHEYIQTYHTQPLLWKRFIDDCFAIWTHGIEALDVFTEHLNTSHPNIRFTGTHSTTHVEFLDTTVRITNHKLTPELYIKPTSSLSYLHRDSCHPRHVFESLHSHSP